MPPKSNFVKSVDVAFREMGKYNILGTFLIYCLSSSSTGQIFKCDSSKNVESCKGVPFVGYNNQSLGYPNLPPTPPKSVQKLATVTFTQFTTMEVGCAGFQSDVKFVTGLGN